MPAPVSVDAVERTSVRASEGQDMAVALFAFYDSWIVPPRV
jgi:hypothetical protein